MDGCLWIGEGVWREPGGNTCKGTQRNFGSDGNVGFLLVVVISWMYKSVKTVQNAYLKKCAVHFL